MSHLYRIYIWSVYTGVGIVIYTDELIPLQSCHSSLFNTGEQYLLSVINSFLLSSYLFSVCLHLLSVLGLSMVHSWKIYRSYKMYIYNYVKFRKNLTYLSKNCKWVYERSGRLRNPGDNSVLKTTRTTKINGKMRNLIRKSYV